jgi:hypothetical protein
VQRKRFLRSNFSSSRLVRTLADWTPDVEASGMDFAERLSLWLNAFDAIGLQAAHQSIRAIRTAAPAEPADARSRRSRSVEEDFREVRSTLANAIARDPMATAAAQAGYSVYRQRHLELQRQMEQMIGPLRDHVRQTLSRVSPRLRQLAALDAVLGQVVASREQTVLPTAAALIERRFEQLRQDQADGWLDVFVADWRQALLAELDLRLEPVAGLIEALSNELKNRQ